MTTFKLMPFLDSMRTLVFSRLGVRTLGAMTLLIDDDGKILLIRQTYGHGSWTFPGGGVGRMESFPEAAIREAREEVGVRLRPDASVELLGLYSKKVARWNDHIAVYVVKGWDAVPLPNREIAEAYRFDLDNLPENTAPSVLKRLAEWQGSASPSNTW